MAGEGDVQTDYEAHSKGYDFFIGLMKWGTIVSFVLAAGAVLLIKSCAG